MKLFYNGLEKLSLLQIPQEQRSEMIAQLSEIVSFVDNLSELSTEGVEAIVRHVRRFHPLT
jgi:aspartyl/glutamyl-tRNA(Asn/Gln) amidotransferase C subunit